MDLMRSTQTMTRDQLRRLSDNYDSVYLHPVRTCDRKGDERSVSCDGFKRGLMFQESFSVGATAVGSVLQLVDGVMTSDLRNGFAVVR